MVIDCAGECDGSAVEDICGVCDGENNCFTYPEVLIDHW
jgi:hypothetical protein